MIYERMTKTGKLVRFKYSKADHDFVMSHLWFINNSGYATTNIKVKGVKRTRMLHRMLMGNPDCFVDHEDGDKLNNRLDNLRLATQSQNQMNRGPQVNNTSGYKGVSYRARDNKFYTYIILKKKQIFLGSFKCKHDAAEAYNKAAIKYHGEFARLNTIRR